MLALSGRDQLPGDGHHDLVELGAHHVLELQSPRALGELHLDVVRQVHRDGLGARIAVTGVVHRIVGVQVRVGAGHLRLVGVGHRETALQSRQHRRVARESLAPFHVLDQHVGLESRLVAEQLVVVGLDRADHDVDPVVLHVQPGDLTRTVVVAGKCFRAQVEVPCETGIFGKAGGLLERTGRAGQRFPPFDAVGHDGKLPGCIAADHAVLAGLARQVGALELLLRHVERIEPGTRRLRADPGHERLVPLQPVPGPVVDLDEAAHGRVRDAREQLAAIARVGLRPEQVVHHLGRVDEQPEHRALLRRQVREVGGQRDRCVDVRPGGHERRGRPALPQRRQGPEVWQPQPWRRGRRDRAWLGRMIGTLRGVLVEYLSTCGRQTGPRARHARGRLPTRRPAGTPTRVGRK